VAVMSSAETKAVHVAKDAAVVAVDKANRRLKQERHKLANREMNDMKVAEDSVKALLKSEGESEDTPPVVKTGVSDEDLIKMKAAVDAINKEAKHPASTSQLQFMQSAKAGTTPQAAAHSLRVLKVAQAAEIRRLKAKLVMAKTLQKKAQAKVAEVVATHAKTLKKKATKLAKKAALLKYEAADLLKKGTTPVAKKQAKAAEAKANTLKQKASDVKKAAAHLKKKAVEFKTGKTPAAKKMDKGGVKPSKGAEKPPIQDSAHAAYCLFADC